MKKAFWLVLVTLTSTPASAGYFDHSANDFYGRCVGAKTFEVACIATAGAYMDMMIALGYKCNDGGVNRLQAKDVLIKYLAEHPENRNAPLPFSAILAFQSAFSCTMYPPQKP